MLHNEFSIVDDDDSHRIDLDLLEPYRTESGAVISAVRAADIIYQWVMFASCHRNSQFSYLRYCAMLGNGRLCPPRLLYRKIDNRRFTSVLSMPANCPVREDIIVSRLRTSVRWERITWFWRSSFDACTGWQSLLSHKFRARSSLSLQWGAQPSLSVVSFSSNVVSVGWLSKEWLQTPFFFRSSETGVKYWSEK